MVPSGPAASMAVQHSAPLKVGRTAARWDLATERQGHGVRREDA
eukprot:CAMPEP_0173438842 /NCGR_PEP_ID=MMETSP1357-20121228/20633_1 /TAXON_ID=77926 /ORGANISM="Hemiselmis rufescens, Strain PCC563" /LENGTH=43 /DNA_ID= /DNA_START= /DNA_END= /DNA_ORIENTATION=